MTIFGTTFEGSLLLDEERQWFTENVLKMQKSICF